MSFPDPGTREARNDGCWCPVLDNRHGLGAYVDDHGTKQFWITEGCPLHSIPTPREEETDLDRA